MAAGMQGVSATVEQINAGSENILSAIVNVNEQIDRGNDITSEILKKSVKYMQDTKNGQEIIVFDTYIIMYYNIPSLTLFRLKITANADSYCVCGFYTFFVKSVMFCVMLIILWNV